MRPIVQTGRRSKRWWTAAGAAFSLGLSVCQIPAGAPPLAEANWIWAGEEDSNCELRKNFTLEATPASAKIQITADNGYELYVNGSLVGDETGVAAEIWQSVERYDLAGRLVKGQNVIGIRGRDLGGVRGVIAALQIEFSDRPALELVTDRTWQAASQGRPIDYAHPEYVEGPEWRKARVIGPMGMAPWGKVAWSEATEQIRAPVASIELNIPGEDFIWPETVAFLSEDCSVYVPVRGDAWGVVFRVNDWSRAYTEFDLPSPSKIGRKLYTLRPGPGAQPRLLWDAGAGVIGSPSASFDGQSLLVAMAVDGEKFFHIYRVSIDGGEPKRLTEGPFHDIDPAELPDGRIVFSSTRIGTFEEYHQPPSRSLFRMNADGSGIHPITSTLIFDNEPKVMADGRIVFIRSDNFFDRGKVETRLHVTRPDGANGLTEIGANVGADYGVRLRAFGYGSPAPLPDGRLAFISNRGAFIATPGGGESDFQKLPGLLGDLAPLPDGRLLCTVLRADGRRMSSDVLGVIDPTDNKVVSLFESSSGSIHSPVFLGARDRPPVIPDYVDAEAAEQPGATGFLFSQDARFTTKAKAGWDRIRAIRVLGAVPLTLRSSHSHIVHVGHETVELGTVPLAADGSFFIEVPADTPLALQAVDAEGRSELNEMSWIYVRPGERRSCLGCHQPRQSTPAADGLRALALQSPPLKLIGQGDPHRFRGNNAGVTGLMDLQFERFREIASLNRQALRSDPLASGQEEIAVLIEQLSSGDEPGRISAAQRLAIFRARKSASALASAIQAENRELRVAATLALAACGTRESVPHLLAALNDSDGVVAQAAGVALENLTGHAPSAIEIEAAIGLAERKKLQVAWRTWLRTNSWEAIEQDLIRRIADEKGKRSAIVALGHIGGGSAREALREWVATEARESPYPVFEKDNRTDQFTFGSESLLNPRDLQEAVRALGQLGDLDAPPLLEDLLMKNLDPRTGNLFLAEAAIEALGRIGGLEAEMALIEGFATLEDYWQYVGWYSDHPALYACHASPLHARVIEALDKMGSSRAGGIVTKLISSVPTDPDRALFPDNDDYETMVGRLIRRSDQGGEVIESCLALLGDPGGRADSELSAAISTTHPSWAGHPGPENRAAQILSMVCRDPADEPRVRGAFERYLARPEETIVRDLSNPTWTPVRHWTLFYLARTLGQLGDRASVDTLRATLADDLNEARHGRPDPSQPEIHFLHFEYTPCWRAAAAWALGQINDPRAVPDLLAAVRNLDNATDVRHAAARALKRIADPGSLPALRELARDYPEVSTRRVLQAACAAMTTPERSTQSLARRMNTE